MKSYDNLLRVPGFSVGTWSCTGTNRRPEAEQLTELPTINIPFSGSYRRHLGARSELVDPLVAVCSNTGEVWRTSHDGPCGDRGLYLRLSPERAAELLPSRDDRGAEAPFRQGHLRLSASTWLAARTLARMLVSARASPHQPDPGASTLEAVDRAEALVEALAGSAWIPKPDLVLAREARARLHLGLTGVEALAEGLGVSPYYLCRVFRQATGTTIHAAVDTLRVRRAADVLARSKGDVAGLALDLGFANHSHLSHRFRRAFGLTPRAWREGGAWGEAGVRSGPARI